VLWIINCWIVKNNQTVFFESLCGDDGENFIEWYCRVREADINSITWEDICADIVGSVNVNDGESSFGIMDGLELLFGIGEGAAEAGIEAQIQALQATVVTLQSQIFVLQGALGSILSRTVADDAIEGFDTIADNITSTANSLTGGNSGNLFQSIQNTFSDLWNNVINPSSSTMSSISSNLSSSVLHAPLI